MNGFIAILLIWVSSTLAYGFGQQVGRKESEIGLVHTIREMVKKKKQEVMNQQLSGNMNEKMLHQNEGYLNCINMVLSLLRSRHERN